MPKAKLDNTPRGPARWERAAVNAIKRPNSQAANLYFARVEVARAVVLDVALAGVNTRAPLRFERRVRAWDGRPETWRTEFSVCSMFCMAMQAQLDLGGTGDAAVRVVLEGTGWARVVALDAKTLKTDVRCQVCGTTIRKK
jgi:hypothetical protein